MKIINFFSSIIEWLGIAFSFIFAWTWTAKTDGVDTVDDDHVNDLQDLKVDTDRVPILQNILGGSSFGYWSQSDANKGIGYLDFDSGSVVPVVGETLTGATSGATGKVMWVDVTGGTWGGGDAAGTVYLGGCSTDCFNNNENVNGSAGGGNILTVNQPDGAVGTDGLVMNGAFVTDNDPPNDWAAHNAATLSTEAGGQVGNCLMVTAPGGDWGAATQQAAALTIGKIYKFSVYFKLGTGGTGQIYLGTTGAGNQIWNSGTISDAGWTQYSFTFEATSIDCYITLISNAATETQLYDEATLYEITPGCTAADGVAFDGGGWTKDITLDLYRQHWDGGTLTKAGSFYSLKCVPSATNNYINWMYDIYDFNEHLAQFLGRTVIIGMWVKTSTASHFRAHIYEQGGASIATDFHSGGGDWEWLEVPYTFGTTATWLYVQFRFEQPPNINGSTIVYHSQPMFVFGKGAGAIIGEGNYRAKPQEFIWGEKAIPSNIYDGLLDQSDLAYTDINLEADSDAMLPKGAKVIAVNTDIEDSGSGAGLDVHLELRKDATAGTFFINSVAGKPNDIHNHQSGLQPCDIYGDVDIHLDASGANALDVNQFEYHGVQIN